MPAQPVYVNWTYPYWTTGGFTPVVPGIGQFPQSEYLGLTTKGGPSVPGYKQLIATRQNATSVISKSMSAGEVQQAFCLSYCPAETLSSGRPVARGYVSAAVAPSMWPTISMVAAPSSSEIQSVRSDASAKFRKKCEERLASFGGMQFLGELPETLEMLRGGLRGLVNQSVRFIRKLKRRYQKRRRSRTFSWKRFVAEAENLYLGWTYGVAPMVSDIEAGLETIAEWQEKKTPSFDVRAVARTNLGQAVSYSFSKGCLHTQATVASIVCAIKGCLSARRFAPPGTTAKALQLIQLDARGFFGNFVPTLYELFPFSFVVDYVSNLGDVINGAFGAQPQLSWCSTSTLVTRRRSRRVVVRDPPRVSANATLRLLPDWNDVKSDGFAHERRITWERSNVIPSVYLKLQAPNIKQAFNMSVLFKVWSGFLSLIGSS